MDNKMNNKMIIPISSSFVKKRLKLYEDKGSGESKLFVGSKKREEEYDEFFNNYDPKNEYIFLKTGLLEYLKVTQMEFLAQKCNHYKDVNIDYYNTKVNYIKSLDDEISFKLVKFTDNARYYIRADEPDKKVFDDILRDIALPKITNLVIEKEDNKFIFDLTLNYDEIMKRDNKDLADEMDKIDNPIDKPHQRIFFGAPGTGKSYKLNKEAGEYFATDNYERVTFHPNYMYGNFIGAFKPFSKREEGSSDKKISYEYIPGALMRMLVKAYQNPEENYLLVIEEINRANVAAVFGDFFQLLDRDKQGNSEYTISSSEEVREYLSEQFKDVSLDASIKERVGNNFEQLFLPNNLYIWATMNSADQGVMPMDTAFRRRWDFEYLGVNDSVNSDFDNYLMRISDNEVITWDSFRRSINKILSSKNVPEDKLLGPYFIPKAALEKAPEEVTKVVRNKVLMYLFEDAGKAYRNQIFRFVDGDLATFSTVCNKFDENIKTLFKDDLELVVVKQDVEESEESIENAPDEENS